MKEQIAAVDRALIEAVRLRSSLDKATGHRAAQARGAVDGAILALRQARAFLESAASGTWVKP